MSIHTLSLLVGAQSPVPLPRAVSDALERVEIDSPIGERGTCRLTFRVEDPALPERFLLDSGALLRLVLVLDEGRGSSVVFDGVMVVHTLSTNVEGTPVLVISGEDLTLLMDLIDVERPFPATPVDTRVRVLLAAYARSASCLWSCRRRCRPRRSQRSVSRISEGRTTATSDRLRTLLDFGSRWTRARLRPRRSRTGDPSLAPIAHARRCRSISTALLTSRRCN